MSNLAVFLKSGSVPSLCSTICDIHSSINLKYCGLQLTKANAHVLVHFNRMATKKWQTELEEDRNVSGVMT